MKNLSQYEKQAIVNVIARGAECQDSFRMALGSHDKSRVYEVRRDLDDHNVWLAIGIDTDGEIIGAAVFTSK